MEKKNLAKIALAAFVLASSAPMAGHANDDTEQKEVLLAGGGCGGSSGAGCGAATSNGQGYRPGYGRQQQQAQQNGYYDTDSSQNPYANPSRPTSYESGDYPTETSSYQGTSTGPGPNGGYPGTPRGMYNPNYPSSSNPSSNQSNPNYQNNGSRR